MSDTEPGEIVLVIPRLADYFEKAVELRELGYDVESAGPRRRFNGKGRVIPVRDVEHPTAPEWIIERVKASPEGLLIDQTFTADFFAVMSKKTGLQRWQIGTLSSALSTLKHEHRLHQTADKRWRIGKAPTA